MNDIASVSKDLPHYSETLSVVKKKKKKKKKQKKKQNKTKTKNKTKKTKQKKTPFFFSKTKKKEKKSLLLRFEVDGLVKMSGTEPFFPCTNCFKKEK